MELPETKILVLLPPGAVRRWQVWLVDRLRNQPGIGVTVAARGGPAPRISGLELLSRVERLVIGICGDRASDWVASGALYDGTEQAGDGGHDLVVDLTGAPHVDAPATRTIRPLYDAGCSESDLLWALVERRAPHLAIADSAAGERVDIGRPAIERPDVLTLALDSAFSRTGLSLLHYIDGVRAGRSMPLNPARCPVLPEDGAARPIARTAHLGALAALGRKLVARADRLVRGAPRWGIAYRRSAATLELLEEPLDLEHFATVPDDGKRYYADPFPFVHGGRTWVFCEELPYASGRGLISVASIDDHGRMSAPRPILETPGHLSYPQVFEADGEIWMVPETASRNQVVLYRCVRFPDKWEEASVLLEGDLHDATVFRHQDRWWMTVGTRDWQASAWDTLALFCSDALAGPWRPHRANPVLTDVTCARPGGTPFLANGSLVRPAQDCSDGYGLRLTLAEIVRLDEAAFEQRCLGSVRFASPVGLGGPHTLNHAGGWQLIDVFGRL